MTHPSTIRHPPSTDSGWCDIVFCSLEDWDDIWRRNQAIVARLARRFPAHRILWTGPPINVSYALSRGRLGVLREVRTMAARLESPDGLPNVHLVKPVKWLPNATALGRTVNQRAERHAVQQAMRRLGIQRPLLWINSHHAVHLFGALGERGLIYDVTDDWTAFPAPGPALERVRAADALLTRAADAVIVCSERLRGLKAAHAERVHLIPNGVEVEHYRTAGETDADAPPMTQGWRAPVLGYTGTLHPERLDMELLLDIACRHAPGTVALIGPDHLPATDRRRLAALPNVALVGPVPYAELPRYMSRFDVCIVPHRCTDFTESLNPLKLFEYLAFGKPIVATDIAGFRDFPGLVHIGSTVAHFLQAIETSLAESPALREARRAEAARHSWDSRVEAVIEVIQACLNRPCERRK